MSVHADHGRAIAWAHAGVCVYGVFLGAVAWHTLIEDYAVRNETAGMLGLTLAVALGLSLWWPVAAWWLSLAGSVLAVAAAEQAISEVVWPGPVLVVHVSVLVLSGLRAEPRVLVTRWLITLAAGLVLGYAFPGGAGPLALADMTVLTGATLVAVAAVRARGEALRGLALARWDTGRALAREALLEERARIARELHDVVAHHMSVVAVQAEAAPYRLQDPPKVLIDSFAVIRTSAVEALDELHRILGLLRDGDPGPAEPQPVIDELGRLVARVAETGAPISMEIVGVRRPLAPSAELSVYRIVQEALSNVLRHAPGAAAHVELAYLPGLLEVRVLNEPSSSPAAGKPAGPGHGLIGMRERVAMLDGELEAGPRAEGGYLVLARLPLTEDGDA
ncbi:histidine kinase [Nonomuraea sp. NPDC050643]|uniref:sensor histidine kinase n=1 Tax=Nonomuraea sp. NPDC050643 TaxID=3155660 RepID=UPI0034013151